MFILEVKPWVSCGTRLASNESTRVCFQHLSGASENNLAQGCVCHDYGKCVVWDQKGSLDIASLLDASTRVLISLNYANCRSRKT